MENKASGQIPTPTELNAAAKLKILDGYGQLPLLFIENAGQADKNVRFYCQGAGFTMGFAPQEAVFTFIQNKNQGVSLALRFIGADPEAKIKASRIAQGKVNYFIGNDPLNWRTNLSTSEELVYQGLWPGVDAAFEGKNGKIKYTFVVQPGADVRNIRLTYRGADKLSLDEEGNLLIHTPYGNLSDDRPVSYQEISGKQVAVSSCFVLNTTDHGELYYGFELGSEYDPRYPLVIDPSLVYSTYLGGTNDDQSISIALDASRNAYVVGITASTDFPVTTGAFQSTYAGGATDAFVTKLNAAGTALVYSTYLGGSGGDQGISIALDSSGNAYVTGFTDSTDFPTTPGAFSPTYNGGIADGFVTKLNSTGTGLVYSTYLGGSGEDNGFGIAVDTLGNAYVTGVTNSTNFPVTIGAFSTTYNGGAFDSFVTKLNPAGSALVYSTYLGGSGFDEGLSIAVDSSGQAFVAGTTDSTNFPTTLGAFQTSFAGVLDVTVTKLNATGTALVYSTYLGGSGDDEGIFITIDASDQAYVTGSTNSTDFPVTSGAFSTMYNGGSSDAFVTKLNFTGTALVYSTYLGGSGEDAGFGIAVDGSGNAYVGGFTSSTNFPVTLNAIQPVYNGGSSDGFVTVLNSVGSALLFSTFLGGSGGESANGIAVDASDNAYVTGTTDSADFPVTPDAAQPSLAGSNDGFITKINTQIPPPTLPPFFRF